MSQTINKDDISRFIVMARGLMNGGGFYWCYVAVKPSRYEEFKKVTANKYNIQNFVKDEFGEVIVSGAGRDAPKEVIDKVAEMFGVSPDSLFTDSHPEATLEKKVEEVLKEMQGG